MAGLLGELATFFDSDDHRVAPLDRLPGAGAERVDDLLEPLHAVEVVVDVVQDVRRRIDDDHVADRELIDADRDHHGRPAPGLPENAG